MAEHVYAVIKVHGKGYAARRADGESYFVEDPAAAYLYYHDWQAEHIAKSVLLLKDDAYELDFINITVGWKRKYSDERG